MNPVRDLALAIAPYMPASEGGQAAAVIISMALNGGALLSVAALAAWLIQKGRGQTW